MSTTVPTEDEFEAERTAQAARDLAQDQSLIAFTGEQATAMAALATKIASLDNAQLAAKVDELTTKVAALEARPVGGAVDISKYGYMPLDQFKGSTTDKLALAVSAVGAITVPQKPTVLLPPQYLNVSDGGQLPPVEGLSMRGVGRGTEFGTGTTLKAPPGGLFGGPVGKGRLSIENLSIEGNLMPWLPTDGSKGVWKDVLLKSVGIKGGRLLSGAFTRALVDNIYINGITTEAAIDAYFTDSWLFPTYCTASGTTKPGVPILRIGASMSRMGAPYVTPQGGAGIEIFYSMGGFTIDGGKADSWRRSIDGKTPALGVVPASAGWKIHGTTGLAVRDLWINNVNGLGVDKGDIVVAADNTDLIFYHPTFAKTYDKQTAIHSGPAIYTEAPIKVYDPITIGGYPKSFVTKGAGKVTCNDPSWISTVAA